MSLSERGRRAAFEEFIRLSLQEASHVSCLVSRVSGSQLLEVLVPLFPDSVFDDR